MTKYKFKRFLIALRSGFFALLLLLLSLWSYLSYQERALPKPHEKAKFYSNQCDDDLGLLYREAIAKAKESILLIIYSLNDPFLIESLEKKANTGVKVTLIHDLKTWPSSLEINGVDRIGKNQRALMHRKILVIDHELILIGSANLSMESLHLDDNLVMGVYSESLAKSIETMQPCAINVNGQPIEWWPLPERKKEALKRVLELVHATKKTIQVAMFTWTHRSLTEEMIELYKRGVDVEIVIDRSSAEGASQKTVLEQERANLDLSLSQGSHLFHHKFAYIDKTLLMMGSTNWTKAAFQKNDESLLIIHDLTTKQMRKIDRLWHAIKCTSREVKG